MLLSHNILDAPPPKKRPIVLMLTMAARILAETGGRFQSHPIDNIPVHG